MGIDARVDSWIQITSDLLGRRFVPGWRWEVLVALSETFDAAASWNWSDGRGSFGFEALGRRATWPSPEHLECWQREIRAQHPLLRWYAASNDPAALSIERVPTAAVAAWDRAGARAFYREFGLEQQLSLPLLVHDEEHSAFVVGRSGDDFSDEDVAVARLIQPLLRLLGRQACVLARLETPTSAYGLTGRETAVVTLLADGLTAGAIGRRLAISERTVQKHLENAYRKLGARDRLSAVAAASAAGLLAPSTPGDEVAQVADDVLVYRHDADRVDAGPGVARPVQPSAGVSASTAMTSMRNPRFATKSESD